VNDIIIIIIIIIIIKFVISELLGDTSNYTKKCFNL